MKLFAWMLTLLLGFSTYAQESSRELIDASRSHLFKKAGELYTQGRYQSAIEELSAVEAKLRSQKKKDKGQLGLVVYWKGITFSKTQDYPAAIKSYEEALRLGFKPQDIHYEFGQALFAAEKLPLAREQFRESVKREFKPAVSLYYMGYISRELGEKKKAFNYLRAIAKINTSEALEVRQAAEMQIGDIYLDQVERHPNAFRGVEKHVIPQYEAAYNLNPDSKLSPTIKEKIIGLQRKYDLILFNLRNGRPTLHPPYYLRLAQEIGMDTNVTYTPTETTVSEAKQASGFTKSSAMGRYTFYLWDFISIAPEANFTYTRYMNREPEIYRNDNTFTSVGLRNAYEHTLWRKPAATLFDLEYSELTRDLRKESDGLEFNSSATTLSIGERFNFFSRGESVIRLRKRIMDSFVDTQDSTTHSLLWEQIVALGLNTLLMYTSYDQVRVKDKLYSTNALTVRADLIMSRVRDWFTPSVGLAFTSVDPINNRNQRGRETLINPNARLAKTFGKNWRGNLRYDYQNNQSEDKQNFAYKKSVYSFELEYLF